MIVSHPRSNIAYAAVISERGRSLFEARGRVQLEASEAALLLRSKLTHICLTVMGIIAGVALMDAFTAAFAFQIGGVVDALAPNAAVPAPKRIGKAVGAAICGGFVSGFIFLLSMSLWKHNVFLQSVGAE